MELQCGDTIRIMDSGGTNTLALTLSPEVQLTMYRPMKRFLKGWGAQTLKKIGIDTHEGQLGTHIS